MLILLRFSFIECYGPFQFYFYWFTLNLHGKIILISCESGLELAGHGSWATITMPDVSEFTAPIIYAVPMQLLAYHTALSKGTDVDQPRNLAKSVTVE